MIEVYLEDVEPDWLNMGPSLTPLVLQLASTRDPAGRLTRNILHWSLPG